MKRWLPLCAGLWLVGCSLMPTPMPQYPNNSLEATVQGFSTAYNADELDQLRLLFHPEKRKTFDREAQRIRADLDRLQVQRYAVGHQVKVNEVLDGHEVTLWLHDGASSQPRTAILVKAEGRWWVWRY